MKYAEEINKRTKVKTNREPERSSILLRLSVIKEAQKEAGKNGKE